MPTTRARELQNGGLLEAIVREDRDEAALLLEVAGRRAFFCPSCVDLDPALAFLRQAPRFPGLRERTAKRQAAFLQDYEAVPRAPRTTLSGVGAVTPRP